MYRVVNPVRHHGAVRAEEGIFNLHTPGRMNISAFLYSGILVIVIIILIVIDTGRMWVALIEANSDYRLHERLRLRLRSRSRLRQAENSEKAEMRPPVRFIFEAAILILALRTFGSWVWSPGFSRFHASTG